MRINKGVEWAGHACALLVPLWPDKGLPLSALAEFHALPEPYMAKQMQALARAGIVTGGRGRSGFYTLACGNHAARHIAGGRWRRADVPLQRDPPERSLRQQARRLQSAVQYRRGVLARRGSLSR